jgi:hypothetical protein
MKTDRWLIFSWVVLLFVLGVTGLGMVRDVLQPRVPSYGRSSLENSSRRTTRDAVSEVSLTVCVYLKPSIPTR